MQGINQARCMAMPNKINRQPALVHPLQKALLICLGIGCNGILYEHPDMMELREMFANLVEW